jgi:hypothetical protein
MCVAGVFLGLAVSTAGRASGPGASSAWFWWWCGPGPFESPGARSRETGWDRVRELPPRGLAPWSFLSIYTLSYVPWMRQGHSLWDMVTQRDIWSYHANSTRLIRTSAAGGPGHCLARPGTLQVRASWTRDPRPRKPCPLVGERPRDRVGPRHRNPGATPAPDLRVRILLLPPGRGAAHPELQPLPLEAIPTPA